MNSTEITPLAEVIYNFAPDRQPWDGDSYSFNEARSRNLKGYQLAVKQARAAAEFLSQK